MLPKFKMADETAKKNKKSSDETLALSSEKQKEFEDKVKKIKPKVSMAVFSFFKSPYDADHERFLMCFRMLMKNSSQVLYTLVIFLMDFMKTKSRISSNSLEQLTE